MPSADGKIRGISIPSVPWHQPKPAPKPSRQAVTFMPEMECINVPGPIEGRRREQLRWHLTRRWSDRVVAERMAECARVEAVNRLRLDEWLKA